MSRWPKTRLEVCERQNLANNKHGQSGDRTCLASYASMIEQRLENFAVFPLLVVERSSVVIYLTDVTTSLLILFLCAFGRCTLRRPAARWLFFVVGIRVGFAVRFTWHLALLLLVPPRLDVGYDTTLPGNYSLPTILCYPDWTRTLAPLA